MVSLISTAGIVLGIKYLQGKGKEGNGGGSGGDVGVGKMSYLEEIEMDSVERRRRRELQLATGGREVWPSNEFVMKVLGVTVVLFALAVGYGDRMRWIRIGLDMGLTASCFSIGMRLPKKVKLWIHPLIFCVVGTMGGLSLFGRITGLGFTQVLKGYLSRGPVANWGGGDILAWLAGPAVITFGHQMDRRRQAMRQRFLQVVCATVLASVISFFGTALVVRALDVSMKARLIMLPRMITAPLAVPIADILGTHVGLASTVVAMTGLLGANFGRAVLNLVGVRDGVARGLAVGSASHGLGTAGISEEKDAFPFAAIAMAMVGIVSTIFVTIPVCRNALISVALGGAQKANILAAISR